ncbi:hypothetical protein TWF730_007829 [Orbilia blumenaviensis]|uniref:Uncharacterized protein n=1 Tax=Orbilia blumenaviensis TaxID=1796055 RepID=A0AAV9VBI8_9PEZI
MTDTGSPGSDHSYTYSANDPDLLELGLTPADVEMTSSEDSSAQGVQDDQSTTQYESLPSDTVDIRLEYVVNMFNKLPRSRYIESVCHRGPNGPDTEEKRRSYYNLWHFSIRHIQLARSYLPQRVLCVWLHGSDFMHIVGILNYDGYEVTDPEATVNPDIRASAIVPQLLRTFNNGFGGRTNAPYQPWSLTMSEDDALATAMENLMKRAGIRTEKSCQIKVLQEDYMTQFERLYFKYERIILTMIGIDTGSPVLMELGDENTSPKAAQNQQGVSGPRKGDDDDSEDEEKEVMEDREEAPEDQQKAVKGQNEAMEDKGVAEDPEKIPGNESEPTMASTVPATPAPFENSEIQRGSRIGPSGRQTRSVRGRKRRRTTNFSSHID